MQGLDIRSRTKLSQKNCSPLTLHNLINIALLTAQNTYALLVGLVEGFPCADTMVETLYCEACHYVSQLVFLLRGVVSILKEE